MDTTVDACSPHCVYPQQSGQPRGASFPLSGQGLAVEHQLSAIDALRAAIERAQRRSASLRRAVLKRAFRGELVPQDPTDEPADQLLARIRAEHERTPARHTGRRSSK